MILMNDAKITVITTGDYHIELFTRSPDVYANRNIIPLRMGMFRVRRDDCDLGKRYFVSDLCERHLDYNAILIHDVEDIELISNTNIEANFTHGELTVYKIGEYDIPGSDKKLSISFDGAHVH